MKGIGTTLGDFCIPRTPEIEGDTCPKVFVGKVAKAQCRIQARLFRLIQTSDRPVAATVVAFGFLICQQRDGKCLEETDVERVWILDHVREWDDGHEDVKLIGVFASEKDAQSALATVRHKPGFCDLPDGFCISEKVLGRIGWTDGYVTLQPGEEFT
ncbi:hypothetical protein [Dyella mobilis]|uniref:hypothetical protein n=1 Tax=Dyella mobilis TaxID=1849582 RepID=UPI0024E1898D|nr:hypothetical protein [Dyella mobilis]